jgi:hypothetical protein
MQNLGSRDCTIMIDHLQQRFDGSFPLHEALTTIMAVDIGETRYAGVMRGQT